MKLPPWAWLMVSLWAIALLYLPVIPGEFIWDDTWLVINSQPLRQNLSQLLLTDYTALSGVSEKVGYWRPSLMLDFRIDDALFGLSPWGWHLHSWAWHILACGLLGALLWKKLPFQGVILTVLFFGLHPLQSEAVAWVAARNDLLCTALGLAGLVILVRGQHWGTALLGGVFASAAVLAKENALFLPVLGFILGVRGARLGGLVVGVIAPWVLRGFLGVGGLPPLEYDRITWVFSLMPNLLGQVFSRLIVPWPLTATLHLRYIEPGFSLSTLPGLLILAGMLTAMGVLFWKRQVLAAGGILWFFLASAPALFAIARTGGYGDRYLYLGMVGLGITLGSVGIEARRLWPVGLLLVGLLEIRLVQWQTNLGLFEAESRANPTPYSQQLYAWYLEQAGRDQEALGLLTPFLQQPEVDEPEGFATGFRSAIKLQQWGLAITFGERVLAGSMAMDEAFYGSMAMAMVACGRGEEGMTYAVRGGEDARARLARAAILLRRGEDIGGLGVDRGVVERLVKQGEAGCDTLRTPTLPTPPQTSAPPPPHSPHPESSPPPSPAQ